MSDQAPPPHDQRPPSYQPPPPNPLIPQASQARKSILAGVSPRLGLGVAIGLVLIVVLVFMVSQPRGTGDGDPTRIALEQTSTQNAAIFITQTFLAITPTIDPQVAALQTQNALLAQGATDQAATNQAVVLLPTQTAFVITSVPQVIIQPTEPPLVQPTAAPPVKIITATPQPTDVPLVKIVTATPQPTQQPTVVPPTPQPTLAQPTQLVPTQPQSAKVQSGIITCSDGRTLSIPVNGQIYKATVNGVNGDNDYLVVYDPSQSGASDIPPNGWWYQPCLPPHPVAFEIAITVNPAVYRFLGPECQVWQNDGTHPFDQGNVLVSRQNVQRLTIPSTKGNESWLFVRCQASDSSGFSFARLP